MQGCKQEIKPQDLSTHANAIIYLTVTPFTTGAKMLWSIHQIDMSNAFCYADIAEDVYMGTSDDKEMEPWWCNK